MAQSFNLTAQINLRAPGNLKPVVNQIKKELGSVTADVKVKIDPRSGKSIDAVTKKLQAMNSVLVTAKTNTDNLNASLANLSASLSNTGSSSVKVNTSIRSTGDSAATAAKNLAMASTQMEEFGRQSALAIRRFAAFSVVTTGIYALINAVNSGAKAFINFDSELIKLQQVTGRGEIGLRNLEKEIRTLAVTLGVSSAELADVASTLAQAGLSAEDTRIALRALAKTELAPSFDNMKETTEGAIAAMRQFGLEAKDLEKVLGSVNAVAAAFAVESADIITAIQRTGSVFATASKGVSEGSDALNEFIAIFTSVRATTRESAETISTGLRTIFTRIQRVKTIDQLRAFGVELQDLEGKFVGPYEAVKRLSAALNQLDPRSAEFAAIVEELGGFRQIGKVIPLIQQFATAQQALAVAQRGQTSIAEAVTTAQKSLAVQLAKVREQFLSLIASVGKSQTFQTFLNLTLRLTSGLISLAGAFKPILPYLAIIGSIKGFSAITQFASGFAGGIKKGGGAKDIGSSIGGRISGAKEKEKSDTTAMAARAIAENTSSLDKLTSAVDALGITIDKAITSIQANTSALGGGGPSTLNSGGKVMAFARGGVVPGTGNRDTVPAMLQPGEFVIRKKAVETLGAGNLHAINKKASGGSIRRAKYALGGKIQKFRRGGGVQDVDYLEARDGDSLRINFTPTSEPYTTLTRLVGADTYELKDKKNQNKALQAKEITGKWAKKKGDAGLLKAFKKANQYDVFGRPMFEAPDLVETLDSKGLLTGRFQEKRLGGIIQKFMAGGKAKETRPFGSGDFPFPKRISNAYFREIDDKVLKSKAEQLGLYGTFAEFPETKRIKVDAQDISDTFESTGFDLNAFKESFKRRTSTLSVFKGMSDFAKFIGLPQEDLSLVLPEHIDFSKMGGLGPRGQFDRTGMGQRGSEGYDLSQFGFGSAQEQDLYGYEKLVAEKQKEIKKILKTPVKTFDDGSFHYDSDAAKKTWDEINDLQIRIANLKSIKMKAEAAVGDQIQAKAAQTGRGAVSLNTAGLTLQKNDTFYHELTHQLFQGLRTRSSETFDKYKARVVSLFEGDNNDLADAFDALENSYNSADVVYGRSYKIGILDKVIQQNRSSNRASRAAQTPEAASDASKFWAQSLGIKKAKDFKPINPDVNKTLLANSISQSFIDRVEDSGKEEFLTTLIQNANRLDPLLQGTLDSTLNELLGSAGITRQKYAAGGIVERMLGYIDYDVIANEANQDTVAKGMEQLGVTGPRLYTDALTKMAVSARKAGDLNKLRAIYGAAGSGKTTLARGQGTDVGTLRKTTRFPILTPEDIKKANEILILSSSVSKSKMDDFFADVDRAYTLSSTTQAEKERVMSQRTARDISGIGLEGREAGTTMSATRDTALGEALLGDALGSRSMVLGRTDSGKLRRKRGNELVEIIKKRIGFTWGGFAPTTAGHESIMDAAAAMGIAPEDFIALVGSNEGIKSDDPSSYRTAVFDQDFRVLLAKAGFGARGATVLPKPMDFEVPQGFDIGEQGGRRKVILPGAGSRAFVADKTPEQMAKYMAAGYEVSNLERTGGISGTQVRDLIMAGDMAKLQEVLSPGVYEIISNNIGRLKNRANALPSIIEQVQASQQTNLDQIEQQIEALGIKRVSKKMIESDPEYAAKVQVLEELRKKRDKIKSAGAFEPYRLLARLAQAEPDKYGLDFSTGTTNANIPPIGSVLPASVSAEKLPASATDIIKKLGGIEEAGRVGGIDANIVRDILRKQKLTATQAAARRKILEKYSALSTQAAPTVDNSGLMQLGVVGMEPYDIRKQEIDKINGRDVNIHYGTLGSQYAESVARMRAKFDEALDELSTSISGGTQTLSTKEKETLGWGNAEGYVFEAVLAKMGARRGINRGDSVDFEGGLGSAAQYFGVPENIPTEAKRTLDSGAKSKARKNFSNWMASMAEFASGGPVKLYHGSNTGVNDSVLKSFQQNGILPNMSSGQGQGSGFYVWNNKASAMKHAKYIVENNGGMLTNAATGGRKMIVELTEVLNPKDWDLDYEIQSGDIGNFIYQNFDRVQEILSKTKGIDLGQGLSDFSLLGKQPEVINEWTGEPIRVFDVGFEEQLPKDIGKYDPKNTSKKVTIDNRMGDLRNGILISKLVKSLQIIDPSILDTLEQEFFDNITSGDKTKAIKYVGSSPLKPSNIELFAKGGGVSSQDTVPALLTPGEFVVNKKAAQKIGYGKLHQLNKADKIQGYNKGGAVGIQKFAYGGLAKDDKELVDYKAEQSGQSVNKFIADLRAGFFKMFKEIQNVAPKQAALRAFSIESKEKIKSIDASSMSDKEKGRAKAQIEKALIDQIRAINPNLASAELKTQAADIMQGLEKGLTLDNIIASSKELTDTFTRTISDAEAYAIAQQRMAEQTGLSADAMGHLVEATDVAADVLREKMGQQFGKLGELFPKLTESFSKTGFGKGLVDISKQFSGEKLAEAIGKKFGFLGASISEGITSKLGAVFNIPGGPVAAIGAAASAIGASLPSLFDKLDSLFGTEIGRSPTAAGAAGAIETAGSYAASGAALGASLFGAPGALIAGIAGAIYGGFEGFNASFQRTALANTLDELNKSSADLDKSFEKLRQNLTFENLGSAERAAGDFAMRSSNLRDLASSNLGWTGYLPTPFGGISEQVQQEALKENVTGSLRTDQAVAELSQNRLRTLSTADIEKRARTVQGGNTEEIYSTSVAVEELTRSMLKARGAIIADTDSIDEYAKVAGSHNQATIASVKARALEEVAINAYVSRRKQEGATEEQINKELYYGRAKALAAGKQIVAEQEKERVKAEQMARAIREVTLTSERLVDVYRRMAAVIDRMNAEIEESTRLSDAYADALSGNAKVVAPSRMDEQVLKNYSAYSMNEVRGAAGNVSNLLGGTAEAKGVTDTVVAAKVIKDQLPALLRENEGRGAEDAISALRDQFSNLGVGGSESINAALDEMEKTLASQEGGIVSGEVTGNEIVNKLSETLEAGAEASLKVLEAFNEGLNKAAQELDKYNNSLSKADDYFRAANRIRVDSELELRRTLGETISFDDMNKSFNDEIKSLTRNITPGGTTDAAKIGEFIRTETARQQAEAAANTSPAGTPGGTSAAVQAQKEYLVKQAASAKKINDANKALEKLANSGEIAANALNMIKQNQQLASNSTDYLRKVMTSNSSELEDMNKDLNAYTAVMSGSASGSDYNSLQFRQQAYRGMDAIQSLMPENVSSRLKARMTRQMLQQTNPELLNQTAYISPEGKAVSIEESLKLAETGVNEDTQRLIDAYNAATANQITANNQLGMNQLQAAQQHYKNMESIFAKLEVTIKGLVDRTRQQIKDDAAALKRPDSGKQDFGPGGKSTDAAIGEGPEKGQGRPSATEAATKIGLFGLAAGGAGYGLNKFRGRGAAAPRTSLDAWNAATGGGKKPSLWSRFTGRGGAPAPKTSLDAWNAATGGGASKPASSSSWWSRFGGQGGGVTKPASGGGGMPTPASRPRPVPKVPNAPTGPKGAGIPGLINTALLLGTAAYSSGFFGGSSEEQNAGPQLMPGINYPGMPNPAAPQQAGTMALTEAIINIQTAVINIGSTSIGGAVGNGALPVGGNNIPITNVAQATQTGPIPLASFDKMLENMSSAGFTPNANSQKEAQIDASVQKETDKEQEQTEPSAMALLKDTWDTMVSMNPGSLGQKAAEGSFKAFQTGNVSEFYGTVAESIPGFAQGKLAKSVINNGEAVTGVDIKKTYDETIGEQRSVAADWAQFGLSLAGLIPGIGEFADVANSAIYALRAGMSDDPNVRNDLLVDSGLSAASAIPFAGYAANAVKFGKAGKTAVGYGTSVAGSYALQGAAGTTKEALKDMDSQELSEPELYAAQAHATKLVQLAQAKSAANLAELSQMAGGLENFQGADLETIIKNKEAELSSDATKRQEYRVSQRTYGQWWGGYEGEDTAKYQQTVSEMASAQLEKAKQMQALQQQRAQTAAVQTVEGAPSTQEVPTEGEVSITPSSITPVGGISAQGSMNIPATTALALQQAVINITSAQINIGDTLPTIPIDGMDNTGTTPITTETIQQDAMTDAAIADAAIATQEAADILADGAIPTDQETGVDNPIMALVNALMINTNSVDMLSGNVQILATNGFGGGVGGGPSGATQVDPQLLAQSAYDPNSEKPLYTPDANKRKSPIDPSKNVDYGKEILDMAALVSGTGGSVTRGYDLRDKPPTTTPPTPADAAQQNTSMLDTIKRMWGALGQTAYINSQGKSVSIEESLSTQSSTGAEAGPPAPTTLPGSGLMEFLKNMGASVMPFGMDPLKAMGPVGAVMDYSGLSDTIRNSMTSAFQTIIAQMRNQQTAGLTPAGGTAANTTLSMDEKSRQYLESFSVSVASFGNYVNTLSKISLPNKIEIIGKYTFDVNIAGAAAFEEMGINLKEEIVEIFQPQIENLHRDLYNKTGGGIGNTTRPTLSNQRG